ncbi:MAG: cation:proton antiporter [Desulfoarculaceae bacterium]|nr:cation:proton antiporter [Desulfoarculaceae bacterium]
MTEGSAFVEIAAILGLATLVGIVGQKLRQPLIIMFLATGILAGPSCLGIIQSYDQVELLAEIGIALLLFIVGLKLDLHLIRTTGPVALATGLGQIIFTSAIGFVIAVALNMDYLTAAYVAVALTFSSTIIIVKLLSDKKEIDSLHGQIAIGFLIIQDIGQRLSGNLRILADHNLGRPRIGRRLSHRHGSSHDHQDAQGPGTTLARPATQPREQVASSP